MKKLLFTTALLIACIATVHAQTSYSIVGGVNLTKLKLSAGSLSVSTDMTVGFHGGLEMATPIGENFKFKTGIIYSLESGDFTSFDYSGYGQERVAKATLEYMYGKVPLIVDYYPARQFSLQGGINSDFLFSAKLKDDNKKEIASGTDGWRRWVPSFTVGANYYLIEKLGIRAAYDIGLMSLNKEEANNYKINKSNITVGLHYTF